jgi:hypothetical protein
MALPFELWIDTELKIMHTRNNCPGAKIPSKYGYLRREYVRTPEQARELDTEYRACEGCKKELERKKSPGGDRSYRYRRHQQEEKIG